MAPREQGAHPLFNPRQEGDGSPIIPGDEAKELALTSVSPIVESNHSLTAIVSPSPSLVCLSRVHLGITFAFLVFIEWVADDLGLSPAKEDAELRG